METSNTKHPAGAVHFLRGSVFVDAGAVFVLAGSWAHILSEALTVIATVFAILWYGVQISESQRWQQFIAWYKRKTGRK